MLKLLKLTAIVSAQGVYEYDDTVEDWFYQEDGAERVFLEINQTDPDEQENGNPGGWSEFTLLLDDTDPDYIKFADWKSQIEEMALLDETFEDTFQPLQFRTQVVSGTNYNVFYGVGDARVLSVDVFEDFDGELEFKDHSFMGAAQGLISSMLAFSVLAISLNI